MVKAATAVDKLLDLLPPLDVGDPHAFIGAMTAIFARYLDEVVDRAVVEIATRSDRPTLKLVRDVCEELSAPIERRLARERRAAEPKPLPRSPRTPDQQMRVDTLVDRARWTLRGRAPSGILAPIRGRR